MPSTKLRQLSAAASIFGLLIPFLTEVHSFGCSSSPTSLHRNSHTQLFYKVYGAPEEKELEDVRKNLNVPEEDKLYTVKFRHWDWVMQLKQQSREADGTVSMAGTGWEACNVLSDYISNPNSGIYWQDKTVLELGSGIGACAIAASLMGANVIATDAASTSLKLLRENAEYYNLERPITVLPLLWGDEEALAEMPPIDILMMSDVIYHNSNRESLKKTIQYVCGPNTLVLIAHTWRVDPDKDQKFFDSLAYECGLQAYEVPEELMPPGYTSRGDDGRLPVSIFCFWR